MNIRHEVEDVLFRRGTPTQSKVQVFDREPSFNSSSSVSLHVFHEVHPLAEQALVALKVPSDHVTEQECGRMPCVF